jgi:hypothetical protein
LGRPVGDALTADKVEAVNMDNGDGVSGHGDACC